MLNVPHFTREALTLGPDDPPDPQKDAVRGRAVRLITQLSKSTTVCFQDLEDKCRGLTSGELPKGIQEQGNALAQIANAVSSAVYFESGAYTDSQANGQKDEHTPSIGQRSRFFDEIKPVLNDMANVGVPQVAHHLLQTLHSFVQFDPPGVFLMISRAIESGKKFNYTFDPMAVKLFQQIIERYLADFRHIFNENTECQKAIVKVLDAFVEAGWPEAHRLVYRFHECFR